MRTLLEKAIVCLLNGDDDKAATLFHKFMVERARQIHESLRQDGSEDTLDENWDSEIKEEEYFDDDELGDPAPDHHDPSMAGADSPIDGGDLGGGGGDVVDDDHHDVPDDETGAPDEFGGEGDNDTFGEEPDEGGEPGLEGKIDDLTDKIDQLTAEFDRVMSEFHDEDDGLGGDDDDGFGAEGGDHDLALPDGDDDDGGDDAIGHDDSGESHDLADRMEDDMTDDDDEGHEPVAEGEMPDFIKDKMKKKDGECEDDDNKADDDGEEIDESDELSDITESVLAELDRIAPPSMTSEVKGVGSNSVKSQLGGGGNTSSPVPHHNVMDRVKGEPVMTKSKNNSSMAREEHPPITEPSTLVKTVRPENRRKSFKDTMKTVPADGDSAAELNKDFAPGMPKPTKSIIDGKTSKG